MVKKCNFLQPLSFFNQIGSKGWLGATVLFIFLVYSCGNSSDEIPDNVVAKAGSSILYLDEIEHMVPPGLDSIDSVELARQYITKWVTGELISEKAIFNIGASNQEINQLVREYRNSLIIKKYKEQLLDKKADIDPTLEEIETFYQANKANYLLKDDIIEGILLKVSLDAPKLKELRKWFTSSSIEDLAEVESYSYQHAAMYDDFREKWVPFKNVEQLFPEKFSNQRRAIKTDDLLEQSDSLFTYMLKITSFKLVNDTAPMSYVEQNITTLLRHKKKLDFFRMLEKDIYNEGIKNKSVIYNPLYE